MDLDSFKGEFIMKLGNQDVEQLNENGEIIYDKDISYSRGELKHIVKEYYNIIGEENDCLIGEYEGIKYACYLKNITYLGTPHPKYKKRVQLGNNFIEKYQYFKAKNMELIILGIYNYHNNLFFVDFDTANYACNKSHNSSAHVLISDFQEAFEKGFYSKIDVRNNKISIFNKDNVSKFLGIKFKGYKDPKLMVFEELNTFFDSIDTYWNGIECYQEMIDNNFNQKFQSEWPGFYLEYLLSSYLKKYDKKGIIQYKQNKGKYDIDLDLEFPLIPAYGDLKCHSLGTSAIPGNDYETIMNVIQDYAIYYVICDHDTVKDSDMDYRTTKFWNTVQHKDDLMSYHAKMKGAVHLRNYMVLEINKYNARYLSEFQKGFINSNGKPRKRKIQIKKKDLPNFVIYKHELQQKKYLKNS